MIYDELVLHAAYRDRSVYIITSGHALYDHQHATATSAAAAAAAYRSLRDVITVGDSSGWTHAGRTPTSHLPYVTLHLLTVIEVIRMRLDLTTQEADSADMNNAARSRNRTTQNRILIRSSQST